MTTDRRWMIDLQYVKKSYKNLEIDDIAYVKSEHSIADTLTKVENKSK